MDDPVAGGRVVTQIAQHFMQPLCVEARFVDEEENEKTRECFGVEQRTTALAHRRSSHAIRASKAVSRQDPLIAWRLCSTKAVARICSTN